MTVLSETEDAVRASSTKLEVVMRLHESAKLINTRLWRSPVRELWMSLPPDGAFSVVMPPRPDRRPLGPRKPKAPGERTAPAREWKPPKPPTPHRIGPAPPCKPPLRDPDLGWSATVAEAVADYPLDPDRSQRWNIVRLLFAVYNITGTLDWSRGWMDHVIAALVAAGVGAPKHTVVGWYRSQMIDDPERLADGCPDPELMNDLVERMLAR
jgi:hypothetical protein